MRRWSAAERFRLLRTSRAGFRRCSDNCRQHQTAAQLRTHLSPKFLFEWVRATLQRLVHPCPPADCRAYDERQLLAGFCQSPAAVMGRKPPAWQTMSHLPCWVTRQGGVPAATRAVSRNSPGAPDCAKAYQGYENCLPAEWTKIR